VDRKGSGRTEIPADRPGILDSPVRGEGRKLLLVRTVELAPIPESGEHCRELAVGLAPGGLMERFAAVVVEFAVAMWSGRVAVLEAVVDEEIAVVSVCS